MSAYALAILAFVSSLASCGFALAKGGSQERIAAAIILANLAATAANETWLHDQRVLLTIDGLTAVGLLPLLMRSASVWLGVVMLLYGIQFGLHAFYFVLERPKDALHVTINNSNFLAISLCLGFGTMVAWRDHRRLKPPAPSPASSAP
jgi:hypothetical protein